MAVEERTEPERKNRTSRNTSDARKQMQWRSEAAHLAHKHVRKRERYACIQRGDAQLSANNSAGEN